MQTIPATTDIEPEPADYYDRLAAALRGIADHLATLAGKDMPRLTVSIDILTGIRDDTASADQRKMATIDAVGLALLGKTGDAHKMSRGGYHYNASGQVGPVGISVFDSITPPSERAKDDEIVRLRAQLAELTGGAS